MHTKKNAAFIIIVALSMLILAFTTFITVYEQILSQNNGFFNVIIFGVVLILVFIFITLLARIIVVKIDNKDASPIISVLIVLGIIATLALFVYIRLGYETSIYPDESDVYNTAEYICDGQLSEGLDVHEHIINYPADFVYGLVLSLFFKIKEASSETYIMVNIAMIIIAAIFMYQTVKLIAGKAFAYIALLIMLFMPNNSFLVYSYNSELFTAAMFLATLYFYELLIYKRFRTTGPSVAIAIMCGVFGGFALSCEPVFYISFIVLTAWAFSAGRHKALFTLFPMILSIVIMTIISIVKSLLMGVSFLDVLIGQLMCFVPTHARGEEIDQSGFLAFYQALSSRLNNPSKFLNDNFYFLTNRNGDSFSVNQAIWLKLADQLIYIFMLILCVLCIVYILRVVYDKIVPTLSVFATLFLGQVLGGINNVNHIYFVAIVFIIGSTTVYYMYLNHHPDYAVFITNSEIRHDHELMLINEGLEEEQEEEEIDNNEEIDEEYFARAKALVFVGENDTLYEQIKEEERNNRINNPIATTRIKTTINEDGEYDSVEEQVEYFDELDEKQEAKAVATVKAIPSTRPVEVVKPILASEYDTSDYTDDNEVEKEIEIHNDVEPDSELKVEGSVEIIKEEDYFDEPDEPANIPSEQSEHVEPIGTPETRAIVETEGFVFRKREKTVSEEPALREKKSRFGKSIKDEKKAEKKSSKSAEKIDKKAEKLNKKELKKQKKLENVKPGEPLPNPLPVPKPHVSKDMDFDMDVDGYDDYDV